MTENEAIKSLQLEGILKIKGTPKRMAEFFSGLDVAITALEEIQQYRAIGTVEEFSSALVDVKKLSRLYEKLNDQEVSEYRKLSKYEAIGTVKECRKARKRRKAKKPIKHGDTRQGLDNDGNSISWQEDCYECPTCGSFLGYVSDCEDEEYQSNYCRCCGQAIDWERREEE